VRPGPRKSGSSRFKDLDKNRDRELQGKEDGATQQRIDTDILGKKRTSRALVDEKPAAIELAVGLDPDTLSRSPLRLEVAVQPNSVRCGFHVALNA
jgi:hypothetical protein